MIAPDAAKAKAYYLSAEQYMSCCDQVWSTDKRSTQLTSRAIPVHGSIVYAKRDHVGSLFKELSRSRARVVLITAESDDPVEESVVIPAQIRCWFSTNSFHPRVRPLPLGLGNSYCELTAKAKDLSAAVGMTKQKLLYVNFRVRTNPDVRLPLWQSYDGADSAGWATRVDGSVDVWQYIEQLATHKFVLCPEGNGIDTHRMWEALYLGTIPIVKRHRALDYLSDLPILFVDSLYEVNRVLLEQTFVKMQMRFSGNVEKLFLPYWSKQFQEAKQRVGSKLRIGQYFFSRLRKSVRHFP